MLKPLLLGAALAAAPLAALAAGEPEITDFVFPFEGPFGSFDELQLQRGLKVFTEVCSNCHGLTLVAYRTLSDEGGPMLPEDQMRAYAAQYSVFDQALDEGQGADRPATPADHYGPSSLAQAPDLSLMAKARKGFEGPYGTGLDQLFNGMGGPEYIASLLTGYRDPPACAPADVEGYYNIAFANGAFPPSCVEANGEHMAPGSWIAMPPPLSEGLVSFDDGARNSVEGMAVDAASFLMWTAEPHLDARKKAGLTGIIFLALLGTLLFFTNKRVWAPIKHGPARGA